MRTRMRHKAVVGYLLAVALLVAGCSSSVTGTPAAGVAASTADSSSSSSSSVPTTTRSATPSSATTTSASRITPVPSSSEDTVVPACGFGQCYTSEADMPAYFGAIVEQLDEYVTVRYQAQYPDLSLPDSYYIDAPITDSCDSINNGVAISIDPSSFYYCRSEKSVNVGLDVLWQLYQLNDYGPTVAVAYQYGHHIVRELGYDAPVEGSPQEQLYELDSFCLAGDMLYYLVREKQLVSVDDVYALDDVLQQISVSDGFGRYSGTADDRYTAFSAGYNNGGQACGQYAPA